MTNRLFIILLFTLSFSVVAQDKVDHVLMISGETKAGQVVGIAANTIEFIHQGESLKYSLNKADISKIEFASGRIEVYNEMPDAKEAGELLDHHNKVAVLPFIYIRNGEQLKGDAVERKVQGEFFSLMQGHIGILNAQSTQETNAILAKNGINDENFVQYTMPEIANLLGVEYIIQSTLEINEKGTTSYNGSSLFLKENQAGNKVSGSSFGASSTQVQYQTNLTQILFNDEGESIWTRTKESFWPNQDAYKETLKFLLKRMPIYQK